MKDRKVSHKVYAMWEYEKEEKGLNKMSQEGWQLEKGGCFHSVFRKDMTKRFIYQIDYKPNLEDKDRYQELFAEAGWEYINSTYNGWHYFKKPYVEGMNIEEEKIYSDKESLYEMQNRYVRLMNIFTVLFLVLCIMMTICSFSNGFGLKMVIEITGCLVMTFLFGMARINVWRKRNDKKPVIDIPMPILYSISFLLLLIGACL